MLLFVVTAENAFFLLYRVIVAVAVSIAVCSARVVSVMAVAAVDVRAGVHVYVVEQDIRVGQTVCLDCGV